MSRLKKALEKAKEARNDLHESAGNTFALSGTVDASRLSDRNRQESMAPVYHKTKICKIDETFVRQNRVLTVCLEDPSDQLKILRTQVLHDLKHSEKNTILISSANYGEGKTLTAINLAISFSHQLHKTVMLVDADIRKPKVHEYLGLGINPGLSDYLVGEYDDVSDLLINPGMDRIVILPSGKPRRNSAELLSSLRMKSLFRDIKHRYSDRVIIFDGAPILEAADPLVFTEFIDGIILVVEAEKTSREDIKRVMEMMKDKNIIGTVFNKYRG
jgi:protein-tyrosine kinase